MEKVKKIKCLDLIHRCYDFWYYAKDSFEVSISPRSMGRMLNQRGYRLLTARPRAEKQTPEAIETFKKTYPEAMAALKTRLGQEVEIEVWFQDEARVGQKNNITRRWHPKERALALLRISVTIQLMYLGQSVLTEVSALPWLCRCAIPTLWHCAQAYPAWSR